MFSLVQTILTFSSTAQAENSRNQEKGKAAAWLIRTFVISYIISKPYILTSLRPTHATIGEQRRRRWSTRERDNDSLKRLPNLGDRTARRKPRSPRPPRADALCYRPFLPSVSKGKQQRPIRTLREEEIGRRNDEETTTTRDSRATAVRRGGEIGAMEKERDE